MLHITKKSRMKLKPVICRQKLNYYLEVLFLFYKYMPYFYLILKEFCTELNEKIEHIACFCNKRF